MPTAAEQLQATFAQAVAVVADLEAKVARLEQEVADVSAGPRTVHVSSSGGDDANSGLSPQRPKKTLAAGYARLRDGAGDRLLLRRGDTWEESLRWDRSGSDDVPLVVGAYGDPSLPPPRIFAADTAFNCDQRDVSNVTWLGLWLQAKPPGLRQNAANGIRVVVGGRNLRVDLCRVEGFRENLVFAPPPAAAGQPQRQFVGVTVMRSIVLDAWSATPGFTGQGMYCDNLDGLSIAECVFDHNGWSDPGGPPDMFSHNVYLSERVVNVDARLNVFSRASSHGLQLRGGGVLDENIFFDNAIGAVVAGDLAAVRHNLFVGGKDINPRLPRGRGLSVESAEAHVEDNLLVHKPFVADGVAMDGAIELKAGDHTPGGVVKASVLRNVVWDFYGNCLDVRAGVASLVLRDNDLGATGKGRKVVNVEAVPAALAAGGNRYSHASDPSAAWFRWGGQTQSLGQFVNAAGDASSTAALPTLTDPARSLPPDFIERARAGKADVAGIIQFVREGFGK